MGRIRPTVRGRSEHQITNLPRYCLKLMATWIEMSMYGYRSTYHFIYIHIFFTSVPIYDTHIYIYMSPTQVETTHCYLPPIYHTLGIVHPGHRDWEVRFASMIVPSHLVKCLILVSSNFPWIPSFTDSHSSGFIMFHQFPLDSEPEQILQS